MARAIHLLTDVQIRHWMRTAEPVAKSDGDGLTFTLSKDGTAAWVLRFRHGGRRRELSLGRYPDMSIADARKAASAARLQVQQGINPADEKRKEKAKARKDWTVRELVADYRRLILADLADSTQRGYERNLKRVESAIGALRVTDVESADVVGVLDRYKALGWVEANTLLIVQKAIFRHAAGKRMVNANPAMGVELSALRGKRPPVRKRLMLTEAELRVVMNAEMATRENLLSVRILLATGVRASELFTGLRENVHLDEGRWHIPSSKTGPATDIPLVPVVVDWFRELLSLAGDSAYVLPARAAGRRERNGGDTHLSKDAIREAIDFWIDEHTPNVRRFTPHDCRSTMKSHMRALGVSHEISEACLNHKQAGVAGIYDQHTYWSERRDALGLWASFLESCRLGKPWNVRPFRQVA